MITVTGACEMIYTHDGGQYGTFLRTLDNMDASECVDECLEYEPCVAVMYDSSTLDCQMFDEVNGNTFSDLSMTFTVKQCPGKYVEKKIPVTILESQCSDLLFMLQHDIPQDNPLQRHLHMLNMPSQV